MANKRNINQYWAASEPKEISDAILDKVENYYKFLSMSGRLDLYRRSWVYYYRPRVTGGRLNPTGEQGELTALSVNHYRNLLSHLETMTTQQRPAFEPRATNSDEKSQAQVVLATGLLDYYMREKKMERYIKSATKASLIFSEAFVRSEWDVTGGQVYGQTETGSPVYEGDLKYSNYNPMNCIRDFTLEAPTDVKWYILRDTANKHDLAAKYPELADDILDDSVDLLEYAATTSLQALGFDDTDNVFIYTLLHEPSEALPQGRMTQCLDNGTILLDGPLPYKEAHVSRIAPDEEEGTIFGYTVGFDLLAVQEGVDILYSTIITNQSTFGVQNILVPKGHDISTSQLAGGLNVTEYDPQVGKPEAFNLTSTPPEVFNFTGILEKTMETLSGVNSVARGNPEASLKSGAALALVQSMAIQFSQNLQQSYCRLVEDVGTSTIKILQEFAAVPRIAAIVGKSNRPLMKEFKGDDLNLITRVMVDMGNPLTRTTSGKVNLADALAERNMIDNPDQYIQVMTTGRLEPVIESKQSQMLLIKGENEQLAEGVMQPVLATDNHVQHLLEHAVVMNNPEIRANPDSPVVKATLTHIQEHLDMVKDPNIAWLQAILFPNGRPAPPAPQAPIAPGQMMNAQPPVQQQAAEVQQPNMPSPPAGTDPVSAGIIEGQQAQP
jgi:hypothetical protein